MSILKEEHVGWVLQFIQILFGVIFFTSGIEKLFLWDDFIAIIRTYAIIPENAVTIAAVIIPAIEIVSGGLIILNLMRVKALYICGGLLLLYTAVISIKWHEGASFDCGCGGVIFGNETIGFRPVARNIILFGILVFSEWRLRRRGNSTSSAARKEADMAGVTGIFANLPAFRRLTLALFLLTIFFAYRVFSPSGQNAASAEVERLRNENSIMKDMVKRSWRNEYGSYENAVEGMKIPADILSDSIYGSTISRNTEPGRLLVLFAASSSDCIVCTKEEINAWNQFMERVPPDKLDMVFLYYDRTGKGSSEFVKRYGITMPVIPEFRPKFFEALNIQRTPCVFVFDDRRRCLYAHIPLNENKEKTGEFIRKIERLLH